MPFVITLVASDTPLSAGHLAVVERFADSHGITLMSEPNWLSEHKAADIAISECLSQEQMGQLHNAMRNDEIDAFCTCGENRRKKLLLADMDSTIVTSETLDEMAEYAGIKDQIAAITDKSMRGEIDFEGALKERVALLKGLDADTMKKTLDRTEISPGAKTLVKTMRNNGAVCVLVSGGFTYFTGKIGGQVGFSQHHGNVLELEDGVLKGTVAEPILNKDAKKVFLNQYIQELGINKGDSMAIGDGANDLPMLEEADLGIGYRPKPLLQAALKNCIRYADLTAALYAQGYKDSEFSA